MVIKRAKLAARQGGQFLPRAKLILCPFYLHELSKLPVLRPKNIV
jgi:hypothetical protein